MLSSLAADLSQRARGQQDLKREEEGREREEEGEKASPASVGGRIYSRKKMFWVSEARPFATQ